MRAINSAVALSKHLNTQLKIVWVKDLKLNSNFTDLFKIPMHENVEIYQPKFSSYHLPFTIRFPSYMYVVKFLFKIKFDESIIINSLDIPVNDFSLIDIKKNVFIAAFNDFYTTKFDSSLFIPQDSILSEIKNLSQSFDNSTYGIHIRRTDNPISISLSPTILFEQEIDSIISNDKNARFFIATDSLFEKKQLIQKYGDRIITLFFDTSRLSNIGIKNAVIDLFLLSRTNMIIGSYWSSFSDIAAKIGGIPLKVLKK